MGPRPQIALNRNGIVGERNLRDRVFRTITTVSRRPFERTRFADLCLANC
jgi:hypothetical protein